MKKNTIHADKVSKGAPSGLVISLAFHCLVFFAAGLFVVFTVVNKPEPSFEPPAPVERPRMKLKKPKVKVKKSSQPKPSSRIVAKVKTRDMPEIQLPDLMGSGEGLLGGTGVGGVFLDLPEIADISVFGTTESIGNDLVGTFYNLQFTRSGNTTAAGAVGKSDAVLPIVRDYMDAGWRRSILSRYRSSQRKLYTSTIAFPDLPSILAPMAFGEGDNVAGYAWVLVYEGTLISCRDIRFRFWGTGDNYLAVAVDGETVLGANNTQSHSDLMAGYDFHTGSFTPLGIGWARNGKWIDLKAGEAHKLQVLVCETDGGASNFMLCVEEDGEEYPLNPFKGGRTLPLFQTAVLSRTQIEELERVIYPGDVTINEGPVFQDFEPKAVDAEPAEVATPEETPAEKRMVRIWTLADGTEFSAELVSAMSDTAWFQTEGHGTIRVSVETLSETDQLYLRLDNPPEIRIDFSEHVNSIPLPPLPPNQQGTPPPIRIMDIGFSVRVKLMYSSRYTYPLTVDYYAVGEEVDGDNYVLWKKGSETFTPSQSNDYSLELRTDRIRRVTYAMQAETSVRGEVWGTYLVTVTDQRGEIIAYKTPNKFLYENLARLKTLPVTRHFDDECIRVAPPRPTNDDRDTGWHNKWIWN